MSHLAFKQVLQQEVGCLPASFPSLEGTTAPVTHDTVTQHVTCLHPGQAFAALHPAVRVVRARQILAVGTRMRCGRARAVEYGASRGEAKDGKGSYLESQVGPGGASIG